MKHIKIAGACINTTPLAWENNRKCLIQCIEEAKNQQVSLLCLPELAISGYGCEDTFFSQYVLDQSLESLKQIAVVAKDIVITVGLPMIYENCLHNVVAIIEDQKILGFVAKQELAGDGIHYEPRWFKRWPEKRVEWVVIDGEEYPFGDLIFEIDGVRIGFEICEDAWNGVRPAQKHYLSNVDIILNPSASHFAFGKTQTRELLVNESSRGFSCAYIYSNLLGNEAGRVIYDGEILIAQNGKLLARNKRFSFQDFQIKSAIIDAHACRTGKKKSFNFEPSYPENIITGTYEFPLARKLATTAPDIAPFESKEEEFLHAVTLGMFDYMRKSYSTGFMLSLSGGADSSACAVLCSYCLQIPLEELGKEGLKKKLSYLKIDWEQPLIQQLLTCVYQGTVNSSDKTLESARELALSLQATWHNWNIQSLLDGYNSMIEETIERKLSWDTDDIPLQNIQARVRAPGIWYLANLKNALLLTTSNRSEAAVGYCTMDGDTAGGLAPLAGIDKASLVNWLKWAQKTLNLPGLSYVNNLQPTAELRPSEKAQTDEKDLMPYPILDKIEKCAIRDYQSPLEVFKRLRGIADDDVMKVYIRRFFTLWARNQWKRERYAPSFHLDDENLDPRTWCRFPILSGSFVEDLKAMDNYTDPI